MPTACDITNRPPAPEHNPGPDVIKKILEESKTIAVVGLSDTPGRPSLDVAVYLKNHGYNVIPVNPKLTEWEGTKAYADLAEVPDPVDIVDIFRRADAIDDMVEQIIAVKPNCAWLQLGIVNNVAGDRLRRAGIQVVQDKCMKIEHSLLVKD